MIKKYDHHVEKIGRLLAGSKMKYSWTLSIDGSMYTVQLHHSKRSKKYRIFINGSMDTRVEGKRSDEFKFVKKLNGVEISINKASSSSPFNLFINGVEFTNINNSEPFYNKPGPMGQSYPKTDPGNSIQMGILNNTRNQGKFVYDVFRGKDNNNPRESGLTDEVMNSDIFFHKDPNVLKTIDEENAERMRKHLKKR